MCVDPQDGLRWRVERQLETSYFATARVTVGLLAGHYEETGADEVAVFCVLEVAALPRADLYRGLEADAGAAEDSSMRR